MQNTNIPNNSNKKKDKPTLPVQPIDVHQLRMQEILKSKGGPKPPLGPPGRGGFPGGKKPLGGFRPGGGPPMGRPR